MTRFFFPNPGFTKDLLNSDGVTKMLTGIGPPIEDEAKRIASRRKGFLEKGIHFDVGEDQGQIIGRLNSDDFKSVWYEFGSAKNEADAMLRSSVESNVGPVTGR